MCSFLLLILLSEISHRVSADETSATKREAVSCIFEISNAGVVSELSFELMPRQESFPAGSFTCGLYTVENDGVLLCTQTKGQESVLCTYIVAGVVAVIFAGECGEFHSWQAGLQEQRRRLNVCLSNRRWMSMSADLVPLDF